jgi:hypothetical protein
MFGQEILSEIDSTLDRLICNAACLQKADLNEFSETELEAFKKTQESLLHHLLHMDEKIKEKKIDQRSAIIKLQKKRLQFDQLNAITKKRISEVESKTPFFIKRKKRFFSFK